MTLLADHKTPEVERIRTTRAAWVLTGVLLGILMSAFCVTWNVTRESEKDSVIHANMDTILTQAKIYQSEFGHFTDSSEKDCTSGVFADPTVAAALDAIQLANNYSGVACTATPNSYAVAAARPALGFFKPTSPYWCADTVHAVCATSDTGTLLQTGECSCSTP